MTKKLVSETIEKDWLDICGMTKLQVLEYFQGLPDNVELDINWHGYSGANGTLAFMREETDEEYSERLHGERVAAEKVLLQKQKQRLSKKEKMDKEIASLEEKLRKLKNGN